MRGRARILGRTRDTLPEGARLSHIPLLAINRQAALTNSHLPAKITAATRRHLAPLAATQNKELNRGADLGVDDDPATLCPCCSRYRPHLPPAYLLRADPSRNASARARHRIRTPRVHTRAACVGRR